MDAPRLDNRTDFVAEPLSRYAADGERLIVVVKASWRVATSGAPLALLPRDEQRPVRFADVPWGDAATSSVRFPADVAVEKPGTDVVVLAAAHAPKGKPVPAFDVKAAVGPVERLLRVHGPRVWTDGGRGLSAAEPAVEVPLVWELAFGGLDTEDLLDVREEPRNPVGRGITRHPAHLTRAPAPQVELATEPITSARGATPAGLGALGPHWEPRRGYAGTHDAAWLDTRAPLPPADQDPRHHLVAAPGMTATPHLRGGEACAFVNLSPLEEVIRFALPSVRLRVTFDVKGRAPARFEPALDTVLVDLWPSRDEALGVVETTWRASVPAPRRKRDALVRVEEARARPEALRAQGAAP